MHAQHTFSGILPHPCNLLFSLAPQCHHRALVPLVLCSADTWGTEDAPLVLKWTPDDNTPDVVYYQCWFHMKLGWEIHVEGQADSNSGGTDDNGNSGGSGCSSTHEFVGRVAKFSSLQHQWKGTVTVLDDCSFMVRSSIHPAKDAVTTIPFHPCFLSLSTSLHLLTSPLSQLPPHPWPCLHRWKTFATTAWPRLCTGGPLQAPLRMRCGGACASRSGACSPRQTAASRASFHWGTA